MKKTEMDNIMKEVDILLMNICDQYDDCTKCPFIVDYSSIRTGNQFYTANCSVIGFMRAYNINRGRIK